MFEGEKIPGPIGKYSQVRVVPLGSATMLFVSGMATVDEYDHDIEAQSEAIFRRMDKLLAEHGASLAHLVKITAFLADIRGEYQKYNAVRNRVFANIDPPPASSSVGITMNLNADLRIEIEGIAIVPAR